MTSNTIKEKKSTRNRAKGKRNSGKLNERKKEVRRSKEGEKDMESKNNK